MPIPQAAKPTPTAARPAQRPVTPAPVAPAAPAARPAPAAPAMIEADVSLSLSGSAKAAANGEVKLEHDFVLRMIKHLLRSPNRFSGISVSFDAATGTYAATGKVKIAGMWIPVLGRARAISDNNQIAFKFEALKIRLGSRGFSAGWLTTKVTKLVVEELQKKSMVASSNPKAGLIRLEPNALLREIKAIPQFMALDTQATRFAVRTSAQGDLWVGLSADAKGPALTHTPQSDIAVSMDDAALKAVLVNALGDNFQLQAVSTQANGMKLDGLVDYKPLSQAASGVKAIIALLALAGNRGAQVNTDPVKVMGPLGLDVKVDGTKLVIVPSLKAARGELAKTLENAGIAYTLTSNGIAVDLAPFMTTRGLLVDKATVKPNQLETHLRVDIDSRVKNPALRPAG